MIFQFKINLKNVGPLVWRRILVDSEMTFREFHYVMLATFDWSGGHLHEFEMRKMAGKNMTDNEVKISPDKEDDFADFDLPLLTMFMSVQEIYYDKKIKLSEFFKQEKDRAFYYYDFEDYWEHVIVLEKILVPDPDIKYPICIKAKNDAPPEDSRGDLIAGLIDLENPNAKEIVNDINYYLQSDNLSEHFLDINDYYD